jgi:hypothetical protein
MMGLRMQQGDDDHDTTSDNSARRSCKVEKLSVADHIVTCPCNKRGRRLGRL